MPNVRLFFFLGEGGVKCPPLTPVATPMGVGRVYGLQRGYPVQTTRGGVSRELILSANPTKSGFNQVAVFELVRAQPDQKCGFRFFFSSFLQVLSY